MRLMESVPSSIPHLPACSRVLCRGDRKQSLSYSWSWKAEKNKSQLIKFLGPFLIGGGALHAPRARGLPQDRAWIIFTWSKGEEHGLCHQTICQGLRCQTIWVQALALHLGAGWSGASGVGPLCLVSLSATCRREL